MSRMLFLTPEEIDELFRQDPATAGDGGFQHFIVRLQKKVRRATQEIRLEEKDLEDIPHFAFDFKKGGWQTRLLTIFGRTLGPRLGREPDSQ